MPACDARISRASKPILLATSTTSSNPMVVFWLDPGASAIRTVMESFIELPAARRAPSEAAAARSSRRERTVAIEHSTSRSNGVILLNQPTTRLFLLAAAATGLFAEDFANASTSRDGYVERGAYRAPRKASETMRRVD